MIARGRQMLELCRIPRDRVAFEHDGHCNGDSVLFVTGCKNGWGKNSAPMVCQFMTEPRTHPDIQFGVGLQVEWFRKLVRNIFFHPYPYPPRFNQKDKYFNHLRHAGAGSRLGCFAQPYAEHIHVTCVREVVVTKLAQMLREIMPQGLGPGPRVRSLGSRA